MNEAGAKLSEPKQDRHIGLDNAIDDLESTLDHLNNLIARINGNDAPPPMDANVKTTPSLNGVLTDSPARIRDISNEIHKKLEEITSLIF